MLDQSCYLVPNSGLAGFGAWQEIDHNALSPLLQFSVRFTF